MRKSRFDVNPYPGLRISEEERTQLVDLVNGFVGSHFQKYKEFIAIDMHRVNERRWKQVNSKDNLNVYMERTQPKASRLSFESWSPTGASNEEGAGGILPVLSTGTLVGELDDLMLGAVNPTPHTMQIKASYVHDLDSGAVLCPVVEPSEEEPFHSIIIKWMTIDAPLQATGIVRVRDFVYIEATGVVHLDNGERVGYQLLHSIEFPQTKPPPDVIRASLSYFSCFRQMEPNVIDTFGSCAVVPGGEVVRLISTRVASEALLAVANLVHCGQMKKLSWLLQRHHSDPDRQGQTHRLQCVICERKLTTGIRGAIGTRPCKLCDASVCFSCRIRRRVSFIGQDGQLVQRKVTFCSKCLSRATRCDAQKVARGQATGRWTHQEFSPSSCSSIAAEMS
jgi:hypothetical protein